MRKRIAAVVEERGEAIMDEHRARMRVVKCWFNGDGAYGYILPEEGGVAVVMHQTWM